MIEIKESDETYKYIEFLDYDCNYMKKGYLIYKDADVFSVGHPYGNDASCSSGKIININDYEFEHNISTDIGSSGCPIILLNNNINFIQVIGIHKEGNYFKKVNGGTFIGEILNEVSLNNLNNFSYDYNNLYTLKIEENEFHEYENPVEHIFSLAYFKEFNEIILAKTNCSDRIINVINLDDIRDDACTSGFTLFCYGNYDFVYRLKNGNLLISDSLEIEIYKPIKSLKSCNNPIFKMKIPESTNYVFCYSIIEL